MTSSELAVKRERPGRIDYWLLIAVWLVAWIGVVMVYSASFVRAEASEGSAFFYLERQLIWVLIGSILMLLVGRIPHRKLNSPAIVYGALGFTLLMLVAVYFPPFGKLIAKSHRWLAFGSFRFQPAELAKVVVVLMLAYQLTLKKEKVREFWTGVAPLLIGPLIVMALIIPEPDLGSCVVIGAATIYMLYVGGTRWLYIGAGIGGGALGAAIMIASKEYRIERVMAFLNPWSDPQGKTYQIIQSLIAFGTGGWTGLGLGNGRQKLFYLPAAHTDFVLANVGEEAGLLGVWVVLGLYAFVTWKAFAISAQAPDRFGRLLAAGLGALFGLQAVFNAAVVMSLLPNKGLAMPFLSYGGSSALVNFILIGLLLSISRSVSENKARRVAAASGPMLGEVAR
jgi:cell division protein FtsW